MTKIQTILSLLLFLVIIFSMDMIFGNPLRETFGSRIGIPGASNTETIGSGKPSIRTNTLNGNMIYSGSGFLESTSPYPKGDDQQLFFGFSN